MYRTKNDLPEATRVKVIDLLDARLADATDLHTQLEQAHWNVKGPDFIALHELFDKINDAVEDYVDDLASASCSSAAPPTGRRARWPSGRPWPSIRT